MECKRCGGAKRVKSPSRFSIALAPDYVWTRCPVCLGMGVQQPKRTYPPPRTEIWWSTPLTDDERKSLHTTEVPPMEAYEDE